MALKPCRECSTQVSTSAVSCPHCGVGNPAGSQNDSLAGQRPEKKGPSVGCLTVILVLVGVIALIAALPKQELTPAQLIEKQKRDAEFSADYNSLTQTGTLLVSLGDANKYEMSIWNSSLDLHIGSRSALRAASLSDLMCRRYFKRPFHQTWKIRVYFVDGTLGAECEIR